MSMTTNLARRTDPLPDDAPHVLVVDDDQKIRDLLGRYLFENGFRVTIAADAGTARAAMRGLAFDLILLDVMMPGESGLSLAQHLKATTRVPVCLLTARAETENRIEGLEIGVDDYVTKPENCCSGSAISCAVVSRGPTPQSMKFVWARSRSSSRAVN
jgi:two-component system, OmpR family, phosphate regulon response regulator OmpR